MTLDRQCKINKAISNNSIIRSIAVPWGKPRSLQSIQDRNYHKQLFLAVKLDPDHIYTNRPIVKGIKYQSLKLKVWLGSWHISWLKSFIPSVSHYLEFNENFTSIYPHWISSFAAINSNLIIIRQVLSERQIYTVSLLSKHFSTFEYRS